MPESALSGVYFCTGHANMSVDNIFRVIVCQVDNDCTVFGNNPFHGVINDLESLKTVGGIPAET
jgi:hypothetical protein